VRVATAAALIAGLLAVLFFLPRPWLAVPIALVAALAGFEWARICLLAGWAARSYAFLVAAAFGALVLWPQQAVFPVAAGFWILVVPAWLWSGVKAAQRIPLLVAGFAVILPPALATLAMRPVDLLAVLVLVWIADIAAYFAGNALGRHKLAPSISPGKTWEGAAGGLLGALAYAIIFGIMIEGISWAPYLAAAALVTVLSVVGDLYESAAKRQAGLKDSGSMLPGHGGILDRIDSAAAALPVAALLLPMVKGAT